MIFKGVQTRSARFGVVRVRSLKAALLFCVATWLAGCSLSAPPPPRDGAQLLTPVAAPQSSEVFELPSRRPSVANGASLYADRCAPCHGVSGQGDGENAQQILSTFGSSPADLTADDTARASTTAEWFTTISNGRIDNGMPPFSSLSIDERWDVIAYVWTLGAPADQLARGASIYAERCVQCHSEDGRGDGTLPDFSALSIYRDVAVGEWDNALNASHVPSFSGRLNSIERVAVIDYVRSFAYDAHAVDVATEPEATPAPEATTAPAEPGQFAINGTIINQTNDVELSGDLEAIVYHFPGGTAQNVVTQTVPVDATGHFTVSDLRDVQAGDVVAAVVSYGNITYPSELVTINGDTTSVDLNINVYEETTDTSAIRIDAFHVVVTPNGDSVTVEEVYVISNGGDRVVANTQDATLLFELPDEASAFQLLDGAVPEAIEQTVDGFGYFDAVIPGNTAVQLTIRYQLPSDAAFDRNFAYPVGSINALIESGAFTLTGDQLIDQGTLSVEGGAYEQYSASALAAGGRLAFRLSGGASNTILIVGAVVAALAIVGGGLVFLRRRESKLAEPSRKTSSDEREQLLDQIAALDDAFDAGEIKEADYRTQREKLKGQLVQLMRDTSS